MYRDRIPFYQEVERLRNSKVLVYVTGDRQNMGTKIHSEVIHFFADHLDTFPSPSVDKISLFIYSPGGDTLAGWSIVNLIRQFCKQFEVIVPSRAQSTATLICLGAEKIVMTKQATLGPIDPSVNNPLNPQIPGAPPQVRMPISVEAIAGYFDLAQKHLNIKSKEHLNSIFLKLTDHVHPVALGNVYRARTQIQMLAEKLLKFHTNADGEKKIKKIISVLCNESGSHDYTINRKEAADELSLPIEKPNTELYGIIKNIFTDIRNELELDSAFNANTILGGQATTDYKCTRGLIESITGGSHRFVTEGVLSTTTVPTPAGPQEAVTDKRIFEGWKYEGI